MPTQLHALKGTAQVHPERMRERAAEPKPTEPVGECPARLGAPTREAWDYLRESCPAGVLTMMDRAQLQIAAILLARMWAEPELMEAKDFTVLMQALSKLGMNPCDRSKVQVAAPAAPENPFKAMLAARSGT